MGTEIPGGGGKERGAGGGELYLTLHCHHQNDFCSTTGSGVHLTAPMSCMHVTHVFLFFVFVLVVAFPRRGI